MTWKKRPVATRVNTVVHFLIGFRQGKILQTHVEFRGQVYFKNRKKLLFLLSLWYCSVYLGVLHHNMRIGTSIYGVLLFQSLN
jgi:hypothetical protein